MELVYREREGTEAYVESYRCVTDRDAEEKYNSFLNCGYESADRYFLGNIEVSLLRKENDLAIITHNRNLNELRVVTEPESGYLDFLKGEDERGSGRTSILFTMVDLEDHGLSIVVRLADSRFVVFDGGWERDHDATALWNTLKSQSEGERPVIAAWVMTHPHIDHYRCSFIFEEMYGDRVDVQNYIYNFPDPVIDERFARISHNDEYKHIGRLSDLVKKRGARYIRAHTGEVFEFPGVRFETLFSPDDHFKVPIKDFNDHALVFKMLSEGQSVLISADAQFDNVKIADKVGSYLKSDILQVPHHFFSGGEIRAYDLISPEVILIPVEDKYAFSFISIYRDSYKHVHEHLLYDVGVKECFVGGVGNVTLKLPYKAHEGAREKMISHIESSKKSMGAVSWYFEGVTKKTANFTILNPVWDDSTVYVDLYFEDTSLFVMDIKITIPKKTFKRLNIITDESVNPQSSDMNRDSLAIKGVPDGVPFVAHFRSEKPIVISGENDAVYYH